MKLKSLLMSAALCLLTLASATANDTHVPIQLDTSQPQTTVVTNCDEQVNQVLQYHAADLQVTATSTDTAFNPRTAFPKKVAVATAGFGPVLSLENCCGGGGWQDHFMENRYLYLTLGLALIGGLLFAVRHRKGHPLRWMYRTRKTEGYAIG